MPDPFDLNELATPAHDAPAAYLETLNDRQRQAVEALDGPVLVLAGAGTGKTRVLTTRLAHLLATGRAYPSQILAVTFTNKAAREMQERVGRLIGGVVEGMPWLGTFHAVAAKILRRHAELVGLKSNFTILDTDDQIRLLKQVIAAADLDEKRWPARGLAGLIDQWKNRGLTPDKIGAGEAQRFADGRGAMLYKAYQERLRTLNAVDFGDLLLHNLTIFQQHPDVLADYQRRFRYILVDEYQDTNISQYLWLRLLAQQHRNICCVGDDDQSIYGWRGAEVGNILRFEADFPGAKVIRLEQNYRSTPQILAAAAGLIAENKGRLGKTLWTEAGHGEKVVVRGVWDGPEEARVVAEMIERLQAQGHALREIAVLVRAGFQTREFEERFLNIGLPYRIIGGPRFYERLEIRDALAYLRLIHQGNDDLAFERIINTPKRGLGPAALQALHITARTGQMPLLRAAQALLETEDLKPAARRALGQFVADIERWRGLMEAVSHIQLAETVLEESGYIALWREDRSPEAPGRLENLAELVRAMSAFDNLGGFLEHVSLVMENNEGGGDDKVSVMTLHAAKGLEFNTVFLPGWEEGVFPNQRALDEGGAPALEEERRLGYVGLTRARRRAIILHAANRQVFGKWQSSLPSRFIDDLPVEHVVHEGGAGLYRGRVKTWEQEAPDEHLMAWTAPRRRPAVIEATPRRAPVVESPSFNIGERVFHDKFGYGTVRAVDGNKLEIEFEHGAPKRVMAGFVRAA
ncbi:MAG: UvrD-helicase domain-containing protein [Sphingomonadales bacterium]|nr:UvrD-helicase domain-containing protein [Sphingomonadales bacterium]